MQLSVHAQRLNHHSRVQVEKSSRYCTDQIPQVLGDTSITLHKEQDLSMAFPVVSEKTPYKQEKLINRPTPELGVKKCSPRMLVNDRSKTGMDTSEMKYPGKHFFTSYVFKTHRTLHDTNHRKKSSMPVWAILLFLFVAITLLGIILAIIGLNVVVSLVQAFIFTVVIYALLGIGVIGIIIALIVGVVQLGRV
jgi:hypothetical protein